MALLGHFYGARRNVFLDYDYLHTVDGHDELRVRFTRFRGLEENTAETIIPTCESWEVAGFSEAELTELQAFLQANMTDILKEAEATRDKDTDLVEETFDIEWGRWVKFSLACYLRGESPEEGVNRILDEAIEELEACELQKQSPQ